MYRLLLCCGLFLALVGNSQAAPPIEFNSPQSNYSLKPHVDYLVDPSRDLTLDDVRQRYQTNPGEFRRFDDNFEAIHFGHSQDAIWLRAIISNNTDRQLPLVFDFDYPHIDRIELYQFHRGTLVGQEVAGDLNSLEDRYYMARNPVLPATLEPGSQSEFFFRITATGLISLPAKVRTEQDFFRHTHTTDIVLYCIFGLYIGFFLYHLLVYVDNRELVYIAFAINTLFRLLYDLYATGEGSLLTPNAIYWNNLAFAYLGAFAAAASLWFHGEFLNLRRYNRWWYYGVMAYAAIFVAGAQYAYFVSPGFFLILGLLQIVLPIFLCVSTLPWVLRGYRPAKIYFFGSLLTLVSVLWSNLSLAGFVPTVANMTILSALGFTLSFIVFSFSISSKIKELTKRQEQALYEAESAQARESAKSEFLAHMSHEIRTPLNGVLGMLQLLSTSKLDKEQKEWVDIINSSGKSLLNIVNDILDYSKIEAGKLSVERTPFSLRNVISEIDNVFSQTHSKSKVTLALDIDSKLPEYVSGDPVRIKQILINLVSNAFKFTDQGSVTVAVKKRHDQVYRLSVRDTGVGISQEQQRRLFGSFEQARGDTHRQFGGTGLGLAICKQLVSLMGGNIGVNSRPGDGSIFWVDLPLPKADKAALDKAGTEPEYNEYQVPAQASSLSILVAEDNHVNQLVVDKMLKQLGHQCTIVKDGCEAVNEIYHHHGDYDIVLMDCDMPRKDGYQATQEIRDFERQRRLTHKPIVALTAHAVEELRQKSLAHGMDDHLDKPVVIRDLQIVLEKYAPLEGDSLQFATS